MSVLKGWGCGGFLCVRSYSELFISVSIFNPLTVLGVGTIVIINPILQMSLREFR